MSALYQHDPTVVATHYSLLQHGHNAVAMCSHTASAVRTCQQPGMYTLIPTVYRALLKSAVSGTDHRIHTTKKTTWKPRQTKCCQSSVEV